MSLFSTTLSQWRTVCSPDCPREQRAFTACELLCKPVSFLALLMIPGFVLLQWCGISVPSWVTSVLHPILVSAAIGYLTNWVAIEMLFKPYEPTLKHPFAWLTLGYWRQGLVPRNKAQLAETMGKKVSEQLLRPEKLAKDLCEMVSDLLENRKIMGQLQEVLKQQILGHRQEIVAFVSPKIEAGVVAELHRLLTLENVQSFWESQIEPRITSEEFRSRMSKVIVGTVREKAPTIAKKLHPQLVEVITDYLQAKMANIPFLPSQWMDKIAEELANKILSRETIEKGIMGWIDNPDTPASLSEGLQEMVRVLRERMKDPEYANTVAKITQELRAHFQAQLTEWLQGNLPKMTEALLAEDALWNWGSSCLASCKPQLETFIQTKGMPMILERLNIENRVQQAVNQQDMKQFHAMINDVVGKHLGAIQVLGFLLGGIAGTLMTLLGSF